MEIIIPIGSFFLGIIITIVWIMFDIPSYRASRSHKKPCDPSMLYPECKRTPNRVFLERHSDRRAWNQSWSEQVSRAYGVMPVDKPIGNIFSKQT